MKIGVIFILIKIRVDNNLHYKDLIILKAFNFIILIKLKIINNKTTLNKILILINLINFRWIKNSKINNNYKIINKISYKIINRVSKRYGIYKILINNSNNRLKISTLDNINRPTTNSIIVEFNN